MNTAASPARRLRDRLREPRILRSLGVHDVFTAMVAAEAGLEALFLGGFGVSASLLGLPDLNHLSMPEMADTIRRVTARVSIPVIADADTGHGELPHVTRTVREFARAGAAGLLLEDQEFPKRCGHFPGKSVIPPEAMIEKLRIAIAAKPDPDFLIFARTDARQVHGIDDAIDRINRYCEAGADVAFVEGPQSVADLEAIARRVPHPLFANMLTGGVTPILSADELERLGYRIVVAPVETLMVTASAVGALCRRWLDRGRVDDALPPDMSFERLKELLGLEDSARSARRGLPRTDDV